MLPPERGVEICTLEYVSSISYDQSIFEALWSDRRRGRRCTPGVECPENKWRTMITTVISRYQYPISVVILSKYIKG